MTTAKPGLKGAERLFVIALALAVAAAWIGAAATFGLTEVTRTRAIALGVALLVTELSFYGLAALLGLKVAQARGVVWRWIRGRFRRA